MTFQKINFTNSKGQQLSARLDFPTDQKPGAYVIFAHCFTCNKNLTAVRTISNALTHNGFGVLRFDFTGLGESEGDFADTNFSSNIQDLIAASAYLEQEFEAPKLLIGHSLGGAAVIFAAKAIPSILAVATIGAPSSPQHVQHLIQSDVEEIKTSGVAKIMIGGRTFSIKKQFLDDINSKDLATTIRNFKKALLVMHSPQDKTVGIENAAEIYGAAMHPKSFISLDGADHLLSNKDDSFYAGNLIAHWVSRYIDSKKI
jgi:alpha/beta superfamily hydrolase